MFKDFIDFLWAGTIGLLSWFFGGADGFVLILLACSIIDQISGLAVGWFQDDISSEAGFKGIAKKAVIFSFVGIAHIIDVHMCGGNPALRTTVCLFYISNEGISIIENAHKLGIPVPRALINHFAGMRDNNK